MKFSGSTLFFSILACLFWGYGIFSAYTISLLLVVFTVFAPPFGILFGLYAGGSVLATWLYSFATWPV